MCLVPDALCFRCALHRSASNIESTRAWPVRILGLHLSFFFSRLIFHVATKTEIPWRRSIRRGARRGPRRNDLANFIIAAIMGADTHRRATGIISRFLEIDAMHGCSQSTGASRESSWLAKSPRAIGKRWFPAGYPPAGRFRRSKGGARNCSNEACSDERRIRNGTVVCNYIVLLNVINELYKDEVW